MGDSLEEIANVTYKRLETVMKEPTIAVQNRAWELVAILIDILQSTMSDEIPDKKRMIFAEAIRDYSKEMYLEKIVEFPTAEDKDQYQFCECLVLFFIVGSQMAEREKLADTKKSQPKNL